MFTGEYQTSENKIPSVVNILRVRLNLWTLRSHLDRHISVTGSRQLCTRSGAVMAELKGFWLTWRIGTHSTWHTALIGSLSVQHWEAVKRAGPCQLSKWTGVTWALGRVCVQAAGSVHVIWSTGLMCKLGLSYIGDHQCYPKHRRSRSGSAQLWSITCNTM